MKANGSTTVVIKLKTPDSQFIAANLNRAFVVPQHVWSKVANPATFTNPHPVGSGPFTTIARFTTQDYVLLEEPELLAGRQAEDRAASSTSRRRRTTQRSR